MKPARTVSLVIGSLLALVGVGASRLDQEWSQPLAALVESSPA